MSTISKNDPFTEQDVVETMHGVKTNGKWHLAGENLSSFWYLIMTDRWEHLQDAPYYEQFYKYMHLELNAQPSKLVEIRAHMNYRWAAIPERLVRQYMDDWRDDWATDKLTEFKGQVVQVSQRGSDPDSTISVCLMTAKRFEIVPLDG